MIAVSLVADDGGRLFLRFDPGDGFDLADFPIEGRAEGMPGIREWVARLRAERASEPTGAELRAEVRQAYFRGMAPG